MFLVVSIAFDLIKHKFLNWSTLHIHLCSFQITHKVKQCTTFLCSNYHSTTNHSTYFSWCELHVPKYGKTFHSPRNFIYKSNKFIRDEIMRNFSQSWLSNQLTILCLVNKFHKIENVLDQKSLDEPYSLTLFLIMYQSIKLAHPGNLFENYLHRLVCLQLMFYKEVKVF